VEAVEHWLGWRDCLAAKARRVQGEQKLLRQMQRQRQPPLAQDAPHGRSH